MKYKPMTRIDFLAVHCSADPADTKKDAADIERYHRSLGWRDVGYHYIIERDGNVVTGRPEDMRGAGEKRINSRAVHVCMIGGSPPVGSDEYRRGLGENNFTPAQWDALAELLLKLHARYPNAEVLGHRDVPGVRKACPSFDTRSWWAQVLKYVEEREALPKGGVVCASV